MTVVNEQISGDQRYKVLNFEEFLLFLIHCAIFWKLEWVNKDQPDVDVEEDEKEDPKKDTKKDPKGKLAA